MELRDIETLRVQGFTDARRGYDKREVDKFLDALADWLETDAPKELGGSAVKRKLELAGKSTAQILLTTQQESEQMRKQTEEECAELRAQTKAAADQTRTAADEYATRVRETTDADCQALRAESTAAADQTRAAADEYAKNTRDKADEDARQLREKAETEARQTREAASAKAKATIEEGARRRAQIDGLVVHLEGRRDETLRELERLHGGLASTIDKHRPPSRAGRRNGRADGGPAKTEQKPVAPKPKAKAESGTSAKVESTASDE